MKTSLKRSLMVLLMFIPAITYAQNALFPTLSGASEIEELDESEIERLTELSTHPIDINTASRSRLMSCGLFTPLQIAALLEYRELTGAIRSYTELSTIDGFTPDYVKLTEPFITLQTRTPNGPPSDRTSQELQLKAAIRQDSGPDTDLTQYSYGGKYKIEFGDRLTVAGATKSSYGELSKPETMTMGATVYGRRRLGKLILGDFNARFGQGLTMWSGWSMSGISTPDAMCKRASGISQSWSYGTSSLRGAAADFELGRWTVTSLTAIPGLRERMEGQADATGSILQAVNVNRLSRKTQLGATMQYDSKGDAAISGDVRWAPGSLMLFGEAACDLNSGVPAAIAGAMWTPMYHHRLGFVARYYPEGYTISQSGAIRTGSKTSDEIGAAVGLGLPWLNLTADACIQPERGVRQLKVLIQAPLSKGRFTVTPRLSARVRQDAQDQRSSKVDARLDGEWQSGEWMAHCRANVVLCKDLAWLGYAEAGYKTEKAWAYLRGGMFDIRNWDDRIYCYERDAPGSFNVPAYYGQGYSASLVTGIRMRRTRLYARICGIKYVTDKPSRLEARLQCLFRL